MISKVYPKETITVYTLKAEILNRPLIDCPAFVNYLNSLNSKFIFHCKYLKEKEFLEIYKNPSFEIAILNPPIFIDLKEKFNQEGLSGPFPLFNIFSQKISSLAKQGAVIFTRVDSPIETLAQLKNKNFGVVNIHAGCFQLSLYEFKKAGLEEKDLQIKSLDSWERVIDSDIKIALPEEPFRLVYIQRELLLGPYASLREKVKKELSL